MFVGIYDIRTPNGTRPSEINAYAKILDLNGIDYRILAVDDPDFWGTVAKMNLFVMRFDQFDSSRQVAADILPVIQSAYGVPCFPEQSEAWHYDDKIRQAMLAEAHDWPMTKSWYFFSRKAAKDWAAEAEFPVVFKLKGGAGSKNVVLVQTRQQANVLIDRMFGKGVFPEKFRPKGSLRTALFSPKAELRNAVGNMYRRYKGQDADPYWARHKNYVLFQEFLPGNTFDTRVTVIGNRAFGFRRMVREKDFRASGSGNIDYNPTNIDQRCVEIAFKVSKSAGYKSMAYDFLFNQTGEPEFCEMSYTYMSYAIEACPGYWDEDLTWHPGHFVPELLHLRDALQDESLIGPEEAT